MANETRESMIPSRFENKQDQDGFCIIPMQVIWDLRLSAGAKVTYGLLRYYTFRDRGFPPQDIMGKEVGADGRTIRRHMVELRETGYIDTVQMGLGQPNQIIIKSLQEQSDTVDKNVNSDRTKMSGQGRTEMSGPISSTKESKLTTKTQKDSEKETPYAQGRVCGREREAGGGEEATTKQPRQLTPTQQAIQDAYNAFPLEGKATDPPGGRKRYSGLAGLVTEKGLPLLREWIDWLTKNPQSVPEGADPWAYFCDQFKDALRKPWQWQKQGAKQGGFSGNNSPQFSRSSGTPGSDGKYPVPEGLLSPEGKDDPLFREFYAKNGPQKPITEHDTMSFGWWDGEWYKFQQLAGRDLPVRGGPHVGMLPSEVRRLYGDEDWERSLGG